MKKVLILLAILALAASPAMAATQLEAGPVQKHGSKLHSKNKHAVKHSKKKMEKHAGKKNGLKKNKIAV